MNVIDRGKYFTSLPRDYYISETRFAEEMIKVWGEQWIYVGHVSQVVERGDYFTFNIANESLIITRSSPTEIKAFFNVCRHRGLKLCDKASGHFPRRIVCPYHSWTYGIDGKLLTATQQPDGEAFDYKDWSLFEAQVNVWQGFIFVSMSKEPMKPVADMIDAQSTANMARIEPEKLKIAYEYVYESNSNWKLLLENGVECYHCTHVHPDFCTSLDVAQMSGYYADDYEPDLVQGIIIPVKHGLETLSIGGNYVSKKLLGEFGRGVPVPDGFGAGFMTQPGYCWSDFHPDHGFVGNCLPVSPTKSIMVCQWFVREDAVEGVDYIVEDMIKLWDVTGREDLAILDRQQVGLSSSRYEPGPNSPTQEPGIRLALEKYLTMMGEAD